MVDTYSVKPIWIRMTAHDKLDAKHGHTDISITCFCIRGQKFGMFWMNEEQNQKKWGDLLPAVIGHP